MGSKRSERENQARVDAIILMQEYESDGTIKDKTHLMDVVNILVNIRSSGKPNIRPDLIKSTIGRNFQNRMYHILCSHINTEDDD